MEADLYWGTSVRMVELKADATYVAKTNATVLITGPSGSGKEVLARYIHQQSGVKGEFLAINCAAIPENLLESLLFGHERGAFTGAFDRQVGLFECASGGTLFLDEIGNMSSILQAKLLRVLQELEFTRLGGHCKIKLSSRIISATHEDLEQAITKRTFREDLFFRLSVFPLTVPSLKSRLDDVPHLFFYFLESLRQKYGLPFVSVDRTIGTRLKEYEWPGNIRELKNAAEYTLLKARGQAVKFEQLPERIQRILRREKLTALAVPRTSDAFLPSLRKDFEIPPGGLRALVKAFERAVITDILKRHGGILNRAYKELGIPKPTLIQRTRLLNIDVPKIKFEATRQLV